MSPTVLREGVDLIILLTISLRILFLVNQMEEFSQAVGSGPGGQAFLLIGLTSQVLLCLLRDHVGAVYSP